MMRGLIAGLWALFAWIACGFSRAELLRFKRRAAWGAERLAGQCRQAWQLVLERAQEALQKHAPAQQATLAEVSEMIDVVRLGLSAGLSFDASLEMYCQNRRTALAGALDGARISWQVGMGSREAELMAVADRMGVRALESFAVSVGQALALGAPLAETLAAQSREIRIAHRAEVERQIERAPVKLLIPTGTLILPALLLSILGPLLAASGMM